MIVLYLEPVLNTYYKTYQNVITLSGRPQGPLSAMVSTISTSNKKLSPFQEGSLLLSPNDSCIHVLTRYPSQFNNSGWNSIKQTDWFMGSDDIPSVLSYLKSNGYSIETEITKLLLKTSIGIGNESSMKSYGKRRMICMFQYNG
jgi:hypothetical protein